MSLLHAAPLAFITRLGAPARFLHLILSLALCSFAIRLMIDANFGASPWDVLHVGLSHHTPLSIGQASILAGVVIVGFTWFGLREKSGLGTILNVLVIGVLIDLLAPVMPHPTHPAAGWGQFLLGVVLAGFGTAAYVSAGFGAGPRDGLMMALHRRYGWPITRVRTAIEVVVLVAGGLLGGPLGPGTLIFALLMGPSVGAGLKLFGFRKQEGAGKGLEG
ncbi:YczE/YyaS/YitT family protein [Deinococcus fonticola]|uniref:YczE/YyaS/YitT family protein n=1 Tax=Deinococcus fonticola TaxID=2528713 RepID=UPI001F0D4CB3|nr:YitT family protein [Deinococcus fonticola]